MTGGRETVAASTLLTAGLTVAVVNPRPLAELTALGHRRQALGAMRVSEQLRLAQATTATVRESLTQHVQGLRDVPVWHARVRLLHTAPGVGPVVAAVLAARLPELGTLTRQQVASGVGEP